MALLVVLPWSLVPTGSYHDHLIHSTAANEWVSSWSQGVAWPPYFDGVNAGLGSSWPSYYPPLYHAACAVWLSLGLEYWGAAGATYVVGMTIGSWLCYGWLRRYASAPAALCGALAFATSPYTVYNIYHRGAYPEGLAMFWLPGVFGGCDAVRGRWVWRSAAPGAVSFAAVTLSNLPGSVIAGYAALIYLAAVSLPRRDWAGLLRGLWVLALGAALSMFFWLPAFLDRAAVNHPTSSILTSPHHFFRVGEMRANPNDRLLDFCIYFAIGAMQVAAVLVWVDGRRSKRDAWIPALALTATGVLFSSDLMRWAYRVLPLLIHLQFSWRFMGVVAPGIALLLASWLDGRALPRWAGMAGALLWVAIPFMIAARCDRVDRGLFRSLHRRVLYDYIPLGGQWRFTTGQDVAHAESDTAAINPRVLRWAPGYHDIAVSAPGPFRLIVGSYADRRWRAKDQNGRDLTAGLDEIDYLGRLSVDAPSGTTRISLRIESTASARAGRLISGVSLLITIALAVVFPELARHLRTREPAPTSHRDAAGDDGPSPRRGTAGATRWWRAPPAP